MLLMLTIDQRIGLPAGERNSYWPTRDNHHQTGTRGYPGPFATTPHPRLGYPVVGC